jgi:phosphate transport system substrate-binding protein
MPVAAIKSRRGNFVKPTVASTSAAMNIQLPNDMRVSLTDTDAPGGYPLAGFTWVLVYKEQAYQGRSLAKVHELARLIRWMTHEGQKYAEPMEYAPLTRGAVEKAEALLKSMTYDGKNILTR